MAKRFIDTQMFRKQRLRDMTKDGKLLFLYLLCECDHAGVWDVETDVASVRLGVEESKLKPEALGDAVEVVDGGRKWILKDFPAFQYGELNPANRVHASVLKRLEEVLAAEEVVEVVPKGKEAQAPKKRASAVQGRSMGMDALPKKLQTEAFLDAWEEWRQYRVEVRHKMTPKTEAAQLGMLAGLGPDKAIETIKTSITNGWRGLFPGKEGRPKGDETVQDRTQPIETQL